LEEFSVLALKGCKVCRKNLSKSFVAVRLESLPELFVYYIGVERLESLQELFVYLYWRGKDGKLTETYCL
jgi:hypothetical protein